MSKKPVIDTTVDDAPTPPPPPATPAIVPDAPTTDENGMTWNGSEWVHYEAAK